jgi:hypothetical protein
VSDVEATKYPLPAYVAALYDAAGENGWNAWTVGVPDPIVIALAKVEPSTKRLYPQDKKIVLPKAVNGVVGVDEIVKLVFDNLKFETYPANPFAALLSVPIRIASVWLNVVADVPVPSDAPFTYKVVWLAPVPARTTAT